MNDCACIYVSEYEAPELYSPRRVIARKQHECAECGRTIQNGEKYEYLFAIWDKKPSVYKTCIDCLSIRNVMFCDGFMHRSMMNDLQEHIEYIDGEIESDCLTELTPRARARVCDIIEEYWDKYPEEDDDE